MFTVARNLVLVATATAGLGFASNTAEAASFDHIDRLAVQLRNQSSQLYWEFRHHYRHATQYNHLMSDAARIYRLADHLHDVAHSGNIAHMRSDLAQLDREFHHLEDLVRDIHFDAHHPFGHGGHIHGSTRHVRRLMNEMEDTLHHLQDDLRNIRPVHSHYHNRPRVGVAPAQGGGITIGNGRVQFRVGF